MTTAERTALIEKVIDRRKPAWSIRALYGQGRLMGVIPAGIAQTAEEAIAYFARCRTLPAGLTDLRAFPR